MASRKHVLNEKQLEEYIDNLTSDDEDVSDESDSDECLGESSETGSCSTRDDDSSSAEDDSDGSSCDSRRSAPPDLCDVALPAIISTAPNRDSNKLQDVDMEKGSQDGAQLMEIEKGSQDGAKLTGMVAPVSNVENPTANIVDSVIDIANLDFIFVGNDNPISFPSNSKSNTLPNIDNSTLPNIDNSTSTLPVVTSSVTADSTSNISPLDDSSSNIPPNSAGRPQRRGRTAARSAKDALNPYPVLNHENIVPESGRGRGRGRGKGRPRGTGQGKGNFLSDVDQPALLNTSDSNSTQTITAVTANVNVSPIVSDVTTSPTPSVTAVSIMNANISIVPIVITGNQASTDGVAKKKMKRAATDIDLSAAIAQAESEGWDVGILTKSKRLKFKGTEKVNYVTKPADEVDYFELLFDEELIENILKFTNAKAIKLSQARPQKRRSPLKDFLPVTPKEFRKFIGLCMLMGNVEMPSLKHYWKKKDLIYRYPVFGDVMPRNRFECILRALRFYDTDVTDITGKERVQYIISHCVNNFKKVYDPMKYLSIDEALLGFKGRLSYKQYLPLKRSRFDIKLYELSSSEGYIMDVLLYTGKSTVEKEDATSGHAFKIVKQLMKPYLNRGHALFLDNFYTSIPLAEYLLRRGTQITGTLRSNRRGVPGVLKQANLKKGESLFVRRGNVLIQRWRDKRDIYVISTRHNGNFETVMNKKHQTVKTKPAAIVEYNQHMGGIDKADQLTSYYTTPRKTTRWQLKVFFHFIDLCLWNAHYLQSVDQKSTIDNAPKLSYLQFRDHVIHKYLDVQQVSRGRKSSKKNEAYSSQHFPKRMATRLRCRYCSSFKKRSASFYCCQICTDEYTGGPIALCTKNDCFRLYHTTILK